MSLAAGPGRGGGNSGLPEELELCIDRHVMYIQSLDTVSHELPSQEEVAHTLTAKRRARVLADRTSPSQWPLLGPHRSPSPGPT